MNVTVFIQQTLDYLCDQYKLPKLKIDFKSENDPYGMIARYNHHNQEVIFYPKFFDYNVNKQTQIVYHEFRHHWQYHNYHDIYMWWITDGLNLNILLYDRSIVTVEEDARIFGASLGQYNGQILLDTYNINILQNFLENGMEPKDIEAAYNLLNSGQKYYAENA